MRPHITIHMVASLDGMIAAKDNNISWLETTDHYEQGVTLTPEDMQQFMSSIDCYVMGSHTYEHALELSKNSGWAYAETPTIVLSSRSLPVKRPNINVYNGDPHTLVTEILTPLYRNVWVVGGAMVTNDFLHRNLADTLRISIMPIILGEGLRFLYPSGREQHIRLRETTAYNSGIVELVYEIQNH